MSMTRIALLLGVVGVAIGLLQTAQHSKGEGTAVAASRSGPIPRPAERLSTDGLVGYWTLDGSWDEAAGGQALSPQRPGGFAANDELRGVSNLAYGPTGEAEGNGATAPDLTELSIERGVTLAGWYFKPDNDVSGTLFGFGEHEWGKASLGVYDRWGYLYIGAGASEEQVMVQYERPEGGCWHHVAAVFPPSFDEGVPAKFYVDGEEVQPTGDQVAQMPDIGLFGEPFTVGAFSGASGGHMRVDDVSVWARALKREEIFTLYSARNTDVLCPGAVQGWEPGERCVFTDEVSRPDAVTEVRVLTDSVVMVVTDPTPWLLDEMAKSCGAYLSELDANEAGVDAWWYQRQYEYAFLETRAHHWPNLMKALTSDQHFVITGEDGAVAAPAPAVHWPVAVREITLPRVSGGEGEVRTLSAEVVLTSYLSLPEAVVPGGRYLIRDAWGNRSPFTYDEDETLSWAIKVDQLGYLADAQNKFAYMGAWLAQAGPLDLVRFQAQPFQVVREGDGEVVYEGAINRRMDDPHQEGEDVYEMAFGEVTSPGRYYIRVPGAGRSLPFTVGQDALGEAFYVHARGLYHNRCGVSLTSARTAWPRGDIHRVLRGGFPPEADDYADHSAEGWGMLDADGNYVSYKTFSAVAATATDELVLEGSGGWHDAADFDRRPQHFQAVEDLVASYLMFPENFTDGQLNLPESGNGLPDILDEAVWGMNIWRQTQGGDGRVSGAIEATSHPAIHDPGADTQPYYLSLATRSSSLLYARHAAMLSRALQQAGASAQAAVWLQSARDAYGFGTGPTRVQTSWQTASGEVHRFIEAPEPNPSHRLWAEIELWLATGDELYGQRLQSAEADALYHQDVGNFWWKYRLIQAVAPAMAEDQLPPGWGEAARGAIIAQADAWLQHQQRHAYRHVWWPPEHGYYELSRWGRNGFMPLRSLVAAWRLTGDERYREAALMGVNYHHGANGMGRVNTTGLGQHRAVAALHLPSFADGIGEPAPGITLFGNHVEIPSQLASRVFGLVEDARSEPPFVGLNVPLMPPPWNNDDMTTDEIQPVLSDVIPKRRRLTALEQNVPSIMEFSVWETVSPAAAVTGCLMGPGWQPSAALKSRQPLEREALRSTSWIMP